MMQKRLISLLLALCVLVALLPAIPVAVQATPEQGSGSIPFQANPLYEGLIDPDYFTSKVTHRPPVYKGSEDYVSLSSAAKQLRKAMVKRDDYIALHFTTDENVEDSIYALDEKALAHTGNPKEGDYLKFTYGGWEAEYEWTYYDGEYQVDAYFYLYYYTTANQEAVMDEYVEDLLDDLDLYDNSDYQKIKGIYDYITDTVRYDYDHLNNSSYLLQYTAYAALVNKTAVCQGYANLFYRLALELDVDARIISGYGGGPHAWNITTLDGLWYNLDSTWDEGQSYYSWFLLSPDSFYDHSRDSEYETSAFHKEYPMDEDDYEYDDVKSNIQIDTQPKNVTVANGKTAKVTVKARGEGLKYQWYVKSADSVSFSKSSVTKSSYSYAMEPEKSGRQVYCQITDKYGNKCKTKTVILNMEGGPEITKQPIGAAAGEGKTVKVTVKASGEGLKYQWYVKAPGSSKFSKSSITKNTYSTKMSADKAGRQVYCVITDASGCKVVTKTVTISQIDITKQPADAYAAKGQTAKASVKADGEGLKYQWYIKNPGKDSFSKSSITGKSYSCKVSSSNDGRQIYCQITDKYGNSVKSKTVTIHLSEGPKIISQPKSLAVGEGEVAKTTVKAEGNGLTYQWYIRNYACEYGKSSVTSATYSCRMYADMTSRQAYCVITDSNGVSVTTNTVILTVIDISQQPVDDYAAEGEIAKASVTATGVGLDYQWYIKNPGKDSFSKSSVTSSRYTCTMTEKISGRQVYCVIEDTFGNTMTTDTVTLYLE